MPAFAAVFVQDPLLDLEVTLRSIEEGLHVGHESLRIAGRKQDRQNLRGEHRVARRFIATLLPSIVENRDAARDHSVGCFEVPGGGVRSPQRKLQPVLDPLQLILRFLQLRDVDRGSHQAKRLAHEIARDDAAHELPSSLPVLLNELLRHFKLEQPARQTVLQRLVHASSVFGHECYLHPAAEISRELAAVMAEFLDGAVDGE